MIRLIILNMPPVAILAASAHAGYLDRFVADPLLGAWIASLAFVLLAAIVELARGRRESSSWFGARLEKLGMLGTMVGFAMMLGAMAAGGDLAQFKINMALVMQGMSIALYTSIVGLGGKLWLDVLTRWAR